MRLRLFQYVLFGVLAIHFTLIAFGGLLPENPISHQFKYELKAYQLPWFSQSWNLFAPNPIHSNNTILYRFYTYQNGRVDTSEWVDVVEPILQEKKGSFFSPAQRILKHLSGLSINLADTKQNIMEYIAKTDSLEQGSDAAAAFHDKMIQKSIGHINLKAYSKYVYAKMQPDLQTMEFDSITMSYRLHSVEFPRFSQRQVDFFDPANSKHQEFYSPVSRIY